MVQVHKDNNAIVPTQPPNLTKVENPMNAKPVIGRTAKKAPNRSAMRISQHQYLAIATELQHQKLDPSPTNIAIVGSPILGKAFPISEISDRRIAAISELIRDLDAADAAVARAKVTGTIQGIKNGETADLLIKAIVTAAVEAATVKQLEGTRKLLLAQEVRFQQRMTRTEKILASLCTEWGIKVPDLDSEVHLPVVESTGQVVRLPRVLVYGIQANQKQPMYDLVRSWDLHDVADIDVGYSTDRLASIRRDYDVIVYNRHYVKIDDIRELKSHGRKVVEAYGSLSDVARHLQVELLELAIEAKKKEEAK